VTCQQVLAVPRAHAFQSLAGQDRRDHVGATPDLGALGGKRRKQRCRHPPGVDCGLVGSVDATVERGGEAGLQLAAAPRRQPLGAKTEGALQVVDPAKLRRLVAVEGNVEGAMSGVTASQPACRLELGDELGIDLRRSDRHPQQVGLAESELADRRQHPGGDAGGASRLGAIQNDGPGTVAGKPPSAAEADRSAADNNHVIGVPIAQALPPPALPGSGPTVGGLGATLSASWAPVPQRCYRAIIVG